MPARSRFAALFRARSVLSGQSAIASRHCALIREHSLTRPRHCIDMAARGGDRIDQITQNLRARAQNVGSSPDGSRNSPASTPSRPDSVDAVSFDCLHQDSGRFSGDGGSVPTTIPAHLLLEVLAVQPQSQLHALHHQQSSPGLPSPHLGKRPASPIASESKRARLSPMCDVDQVSVKMEDAMTGVAPAKELPSDTDVFCTVPGRLSLLNQNSRYNVTVGEIRRRLGCPEGLNASIMGGLLRKAKSKHGNKSLRQEFEASGLFVEERKRKSSQMNLLTSLVEVEALSLADDVDRLLKHDFPIVDVVHYVNKSAVNQDKELRKTKLEHVADIMKEFNGVLSDDRSHHAREDRSPVLPPDVQAPLQQFSNITHGFGVPMLQSVIELVMRYVTLQLQMLSGSAPVSMSLYPLMPSPPEMKKGPPPTPLRLPAIPPVSVMPNPITMEQYAAMLLKSPMVEQLMKQLSQAS